MDFKELAELFLNISNCCNELAATEEKEKAGEDVGEEYEKLIGRFMMLMVKAQSISK